MRYMGIDYGSKRVGVAVSDEEGKFALPKMVLQNSAKLLDELNRIICENEISTIVLGESKNFKGEDNTIMKDVREFKEKIENNLGKTVIFEPEFLTSHAAQRFQGKNDMHDASAAALILQSYLDRVNQN
jgi:putative holliday junction resolvase